MSKPTLKDKLEKIKKIVFATDEPAAQTFTDYKLKDGTAVSIDKLVVGGVVKIADAPAPDGAYVLEDGTSVTVVGGVITEVEAAAVESTEPTEMKTPAQMKAALATFAAPGVTPDLTKLVTVLSACFDYCFGWEIRQAEDKVKRDNAIATYKSGFAKVEKQVADQKEANKLLYELVEAFAEESKETPTEIPADWDNMSELQKRRHLRNEKEKK